MDTSSGGQTLGLVETKGGGQRNRTGGDEGRRTEDLDWWRRGEEDRGLGLVETRGGGQMTRTGGDEGKRTEN